MDGTEVLKRVRSEVVDIADHLPLGEIADRLPLDEIADFADRLPLADRFMAGRRRSRRTAWWAIAPWLAVAAVVTAVAVVCVLLRRGDDERTSDARPDDRESDTSETGETSSRGLGSDEGDKRFHRSA